MEYRRSVLSEVALGVELTTYVINKSSFFGLIRLDFPDPFGTLPVDGQEVPLRNAITIAVHAWACRVGHGVESYRFQFQFGLRWPRTSNWINQCTQCQIIHFLLFDHHATFSYMGHWHEASAITVFIAVIGLWVQ